jgi:hypothetical protein
MACYFIHHSLPTPGCCLPQHPVLLSAITAADGTRTNMFFRGAQMWVEYAAPCVPKPKPIIKAPVVNVPITSTSCDPAAVQALADSVKGQVTAGMDPAQAALVYVEVVNCSVRRDNQHSLVLLHVFGLVSI